MNVGEMRILLRLVLNKVSAFRSSYVRSFFITVFGGSPTHVVATGKLDHRSYGSSRGPLVAPNATLMEDTAATS